MPNFKYKWTANRIHSLRLRLGWSCSDLARRLDCSPTLVEDWENNKKTPVEDHTALLEFLENQAESISLEIQYCPIAETKLKDTLKSQILMDDLI